MCRALSVVHSICLFVDNGLVIKMMIFIYWVTDDIDNCYEVLRLCRLYLCDCIE